MNSEYIPIILQTVVIIGAIVGAFIASRERLVRVETRCDHIEKNTQDLKSDHRNLSNKVDGISRHVSKVEGAVEHKLAQSSG